MKISNAVAALALALSMILLAACDGDSPVHQLERTFHVRCFDYGVLTYEADLIEGYKTQDGGRVHLPENKCVMVQIKS